MALGANPGDLLRMVPGEGLKVALTGLAAGAGAALLAARLLASELYGVTPRDPQAFGFAAAALVVVAMAGAYLSARRAMRMKEWHETSIAIAKPACEQSVMRLCRSSFGAYAIECSTKSRRPQSPRIYA